jgi:hypothetical protein
MQSKLFQASLARPSDRSGVATRIMAKIFSGTDLIPRHHDSSLETARSIRSVSTRSSLQAASDPDPRSSRQSIPIAIATRPTV